MLLFMISLNIQFHCVQFCSLMNMNTEGEDDWTDREMLKKKYFFLAQPLIQSSIITISLPERLSIWWWLKLFFSIITKSWAGMAGTHWAENCKFLTRQISVFYQPFFLNLFHFPNSLKFTQEFQLGISTSAATFS